MTTKHKISEKVEAAVKTLQAHSINISHKYKLKVFLEGPVSCRKGCSYCCTYPVLVGILEALYIYRYLKKNYLWTETLRSSLSKTSESVRWLSLDVWLLSDIVCPLAKYAETQDSFESPKGVCSIYEARPFSCRTVYSRSLPDLCNPLRSGGMISLVPRKEALQDYSSVEETLLRSNYLSRIVLPLSTALLLASDIVEGRIDIKNLGGIIWASYLSC